MKKQIFSNAMAAANHLKNSAMVGDSSSKHRRSFASQKGRGNFLRIFIGSVFVLFLLCGSAIGQVFCLIAEDNRDFSVFIYKKGGGKYDAHIHYYGRFYEYKDGSINKDGRLSFSGRRDKKTYAFLITPISDYFYFSQAGTSFPDVKLKGDVERLANELGHGRSQSSSSQSQSSSSSQSQSSSSQSQQPVVQTYECGVCGGGGRLNYNHGYGQTRENCHGCEGTGRTTKERRFLVNCSECSGTGWFDKSQHIHCVICKGAGKIYHR